MTTVQNDDPTECLLAAQRLAVNTLYRAFNDKNPDLLDNVLTADWEDIPPAPGQAPGVKGMKPLVAGFITVLPDIKIVIHDLLQVPGRIAVRAEITGTHRGEIFGIPGTGIPVNFSIHEFHEMEGDRIKRTWHQEDWFGFFQQVGQFPSIK